MNTNKQEKIVCQGVNFIVRDFDECLEGQDNGFTFHVPFILSADEETVKCARSSIESEIDHGANYEIIREDVGFITNKNRFVDPQEAAHIALDNDQVDDVNKLWDVFAKQKNEKDRNRMQEIIYEKTSLMLRSGLKPEDLY